MVNAMTVDVEDYFQVSAFEGAVRRLDWEGIPCRVEANTDRILSLFDSHGVKATFFMLGWVAKRYPELVRRILAAGHELASHGMSHVRVTTQTPADFRNDVVATKQLLEDIAVVIDPEEDRFVVLRLAGVKYIRTLGKAVLPQDGSFFYVG